MTRGIGLALALAVAITGCAAPPPPSNPDRTASPRATAEQVPTSSPSASPDRAEAAAEELEQLAELLEAIHPDPYHGIDRGEFVDALDAYRERLEEMTPEESVVELMRTWALLSREGRDGHQFALPAPAQDGPILPLRVYEFAEGLFVTDALPPHADLVGSRIVAVDGHPIGDVLAALEPLVPRDGPATVPAFRPRLLLRTTVLQGLGLAGPEAVELLLVDADGRERTVAVDPVAEAAYEAWAGRFGMWQLPLHPQSRYLRERDSFSFERLADGTALYLRYRFVAGPVLSDVREAIADEPIERLILDLRQNPGGNNGTYRALLRLVQEWASAHPGSTFVLTDRVTFSAATNLATDIEASTDAVFVGEAMGGAPNLYGDVSWVDLPSMAIPMRVAISTRYWERSTPDDPRLTIEPDLAVPVRAADHFAHLDPTLEAALDADLPEGR